MQQSKIEWTNATWNPVTGCKKISPGCDHCYAERFAERFRGVKNHPYEQGFDLRLWPARLSQPIKWKKPRMVFVNSMSDLFNKEIPFSYIDDVFDSMLQADHHIYQVLTKRSSIMRRYVNSRFKDRPVPEHIWLGVSVEDAKRKSRIRHLQETNAMVRFLSIEPLIGRVGELDLSGIHWVIVGGESGPGFRPMREEWAIEVLDQCEQAEVAFFFKQWGGIRPSSNGRELRKKTWGRFPQVDHPLAYSPAAE